MRAALEKGHGSVALAARFLQAIEPSTSPQLTRTGDNGLSTSRVIASSAERMTMTKDRAILGCYAFAAIAVLVSLVFGDDAILGMGWTMDILGGTVEAVWTAALFLCLAAVFFGGWWAGYHYCNSEHEAANRARNQFEEILAENTPAKVAARQKRTEELLKEASASGSRPDGSPKG